jgi:hypothetical protein
MNKQYPLKLTAWVLLALAGLPALAQPGADEVHVGMEAEAPKVITINREAGVIDLAAKMVPAEPQWLELIATTPGPKGREHEAIVTIDAKPSHIHLALVTLGLEPGHPLMNRREGEAILTEPPAGPAVELFFVYEKDGQTLETPVHEWVLDAETGEPLPACQWLFTGSVFKQWQGRAYYMADEAGTIASLVNFGDDLIVRQTDTSQDTDFQQLQINKEVIAPYGSELVLRIRIPHAPPDDAPKQMDQTSTEPDDGEASDKPVPAEP